MTEKKKPARRKPSKAAKMKAVETPSDDATEDQASTGTPQATSEGVPVGEFEGKLYTTGIWKGLPNYECLFCAFSTVTHHTALEHAADAHSPTVPEEEIIDTGLVGPGGDPLTRAVQPRED